MKRVLIPMALVGDGLDENAFVRSTYTRRILEFGLIPITITPNVPLAMVEHLYLEASGVMLLGGADFAPDLYGADSHPLTVPGPRARDEFELALVRRAVRDRKPLLGICRGCQAMAVALGGSLLQHSPENFPDETHSMDGVANYSNWTTLCHDVDLIAGSRIARICGSERVQMNSAHHQAIRDTGRSLIVTGRSPGGCIEFVEHVDREYFGLGVQAHPEAMPHEHATSIFSAFAEAVRGSHSDFENFTAQGSFILQRDSVIDAARPGLT